MSRTLAWESERKKPFLYDGARLVAVLEEHKQARLRQEEERRRLRVRENITAIVWLWHLQEHANELLC
jgi:Ase1/PRC1/MAP65 family protein